LLAGGPKFGGRMGEVAVVEDAAAPAPAASAEDRMRMEGWLYLIRSNRFGLQYSRKRYFVLEDAALRCYKAPPASKREVNNRLVRSGVAMRSFSAADFGVVFFLPFCGALGRHKLGCSLWRGSVLVSQLKLRY
jgi:hypothetical protein